MVHVAQADFQTRFECEGCGLQYAEKTWAEKCETWCTEHHSCHLEIIQHAVSDEGGELNA